jgi:hypothetical protein
LVIKPLESFFKTPCNQNKILLGDICIPLAALISNLEKKNLLLAILYAFSLLTLLLALTLGVNYV